MASDDLTVRVLIEIRDQITQLRIETTERLDGHDRHFAQLSTDMGAMRTEMVAVHGVLKDVATVMKGRRKLEARVDRCEREIDELKRKLG